ncbi:MAG TPA: GFA family protein [Povalibacter sp.]|nr:GFA family protein [Povalibacter sp.]
MYQGSCLCGEVKYELTGEIGSGLFCHCSRCRKANGSAFAANAPIATADLRIVSGAALLKRFSTAEGVHRVFCSNCGSPLFSRRDHAPETLRLRLGTLDTPLTRGPQAHIFTASKAEWFEINDSLPQFPQRPE